MRFLRMRRGSSTRSAANDGTVMSSPTMSAANDVEACSVSQTAVAPDRTPPARIPAWLQPAARPRRAFGITVAASAPRALDTGWLRADASTKRKVAVRTAPVVVRLTAVAVPAPLKTLNPMIQVRRRNLMSTAGAQSTYQIAGDCTSALMEAMRSTLSPSRRSKYGSATAATPLKQPYGMAATPNSHTGG